MQTTILASQQVVEYKDIASVTSLLLFFRISKLQSENFLNLPPGLKMGGNRKGFDKINTLPPNIKVIFIHAFVSAFDLSFKVVIAMGALTLISALFMRNVKPKLKSDEKDGGSAGLSE